MSEKIRITYSILDNLKFISHADTTRLLFRLFQMINLPVQFSEGFSPHPLASFSVPRAVGMASSCEVIDVTLFQNIDLLKTKEQLSACAPVGFAVISVETIDSSCVKLNDFSHALYTVYLPEQLACSQALLNNFLQQEEIIVQKNKKGVVVEFNIRPFIFELLWQNNLLKMDLKVAQDSVSPFLLLGKLFPDYEDVLGLLVVREKLLV